MGIGILVCGLNGSGKSTLGRALAEALGYPFLDIEDLYFPKDDPNYLYASPRTDAEVGALLLDTVQRHQSFVLAAVRGNYGDAVLPYYTHAVLIDVPKEVRIQRVRNRSFQKFGARMLPGGDLYETEERFFQKIFERPEDYAERWLSTLPIPVLRVDGTRPIQENISYIVSWLREEVPL